MHALGGVLPVNKITAVGHSGSWDATAPLDGQQPWVQVIESSPVSYAFVDTGYVIRAANAAWCELFDRPKSAVIGQSLLELVHQQDLEDVKAHSDLAITNEQMTTWRARHLRRDGTIFWGQVTVTPTYDSTGSLIGLGGSIIDVTDDAAARSALAESERNFRILAKNSSDLVLWIQGRKIRWASPAASQFGWNPDVLINKTALDIVHPDDRYLCDAARESRDLRVEDARLRFRLLTADGDFCWVDAHASPYLDETGAPDGTMSVIRDISAQVAAEEALRASEREFRLLAENAADVVIRFDESYVRRWVSGSVRDLLGWEPDQFLAAPLELLIHPDDQPNEYRGGEYPPALIDTAPEFRIKTGDGRWVWVSRKSRTLIDGTHVEALRCIDDEVTARRIAQVAISDLAFRSSHDGLTGLPNREAVIASLQCSLDDCSANNKVGVLVIDIDRFKDINDAGSHSVGDEVLRRVAAILNTHVGTAGQTNSTACAGRIGADEFAIILGDIRDTGQATECAQAIHASMSAAEIGANGSRVPLTVSIGIAVSNAEQTAPEMLRNASAALHEAKATGRNRWILADEAICAGVGLTGRIRAGIDAGQFHAWYQPIVDLADRRVLGYEALARWITPDGVVAASDFITAAESSGMINQLGKHVLTESIARIPYLPTDQIMSINASASQLMTDGFAAYVLEQLERHHANPRQLVVEITEHSLFNLESPAREGLTSLTDVGIGIYVDDFGTGYSSLATLLDFPVTGLKLDRFFTQRLTSDSDNTANRLVAGLIELTNRLNLRGIAEGVETEEQESLLGKIGWHCGQGWLFGHAEPPQVTPLPTMRTSATLDISDQATVDISDQATADRRLHID